MMYSPLICEKPGNMPSMGQVAVLAVGSTLLSTPWETLSEKTSPEKKEALAG